MNTKSVRADFGDRQIEIEVPADAAVVEFQDPPTLLADPQAEVRRALENPYGGPPLSALAKPGMRVAIGFDDPTRPPPPWQTILPILVEELLKAGVREDDLLFICANGAHRKWRPGELAAFLGPQIFDRFWPRRRIVNHDCHDPAELSFLGITERGGHVEHNRSFVEADLPIYVGTVSASYVGGYTGLGAVTGLASAQSLASHHSHQHWDHPASTTGDHHTMMYRGVKAEVNAYLETAIGKRIFYVNSVSGIKGRLVGIFAGHSPEIEPPAWALADTFNRYPVPQADVMIIGLAHSFAYGPADNPFIAMVGGCNPPRNWLNRPVLRDGGVVIALSPSAGRIDPRTFPSYQEVIDLYRRHFDIAELAEYEAEISHRPDYLHRYTHGHAYHPRHPFWLLYIADYTLKRAGRVIMAGSGNPGAFRDLGIAPARDFAAAWRMATKIVGPDPVTVVQG
jgi:hypothetical protein